MLEFATCGTAQIQLETRLRSEKEKGDDLAKVCEEKDEQIAHLRRWVWRAAAPGVARLRFMISLILG